MGEPQLASANDRCIRGENALGLSGKQAVNAYGASKLEVSDTADAFIPDGSYLKDTEDAVEE